MLFIAGLGNPGSEYDATRHNIGFEVIDRLADLYRFGTPKVFKGAEQFRGRMHDQDLILLKPMTYMNLSGQPIGNIVRYYKGDVESLIIVHDELDFPPGEVRLKQSGGHGGHNGLRSIIEHLGRDFARVRVGVGKPKHGDGAGHVLGRFNKTERPLIDEALVDATDAIELILTKGLKAAMNNIHRPMQPAVAVS